MYISHVISEYLIEHLSLSIGGFCSKFEQSSSLYTDGCVHSLTIVFLKDADVLLRLEYRVLIRLLYRPGSP
jgi:hypothetical protein